MLILALYPAISGNNVLLGNSRVRINTAIPRQTPMPPEVALSSLIFCKPAAGTPKSLAKAVTSEGVIIVITLSILQKRIKRKGLLQSPNENGDSK